MEMQGVEPPRVAETSDPVEQAVVKLSVLEKFLTLRGLTPKTQSRVGVKPPPAKKAELLSKTYTKRRHGRKTEAQRAALREPEDLFSDSVDAYVPRKRQQTLLNLHKDEQEVNGVFLTETRALSFERAVLDKVVCDRAENREQFEERLWELLATQRGLQPADDGDDGDEDDLPVEQEASEVERESWKCNQDSHVAQM